MPAPQGPLDQHGFPVPQRFDKPAAELPTGSREVRKRRLRWVFMPLLIAAIVALLWKSQLADVGRQAMAQHYLRLAVERAGSDDYPAALSEADNAVRWASDSFEVRLIRAQIHQRLNNVPEAIEDYSKALEVDSRLKDHERAHLLLERGSLYQRLNKQPESLADLNRAFELKPARTSTYANSRAYIRALFNVELDEALKDIELAFQWDGQLPGKETNASYLDTRGYIYYRLGKQKEALKDLERAIEISEREHQKHQDDQPTDPVLLRRWQLLDKYKRESLAVMYHHRGEVHATLGNKSQAEADLKRGEEFGYNPAEGVQ